MKQVKIVHSGTTYIVDIDELNRWKWTSLTSMGAPAQASKEFLEASRYDQTFQAAVATALKVLEAVTPKPAEPTPKKRFSRLIE